jgi:pimeloyl-ACP methyl ester carboxylesterase
VADAVGVLDAYGIEAAHVVGVSAGGALAQQVALGFPDRVRSLVLISTSPATAVGRSLPSATERFTDFLDGGRAARGGVHLEALSLEEVAHKADDLRLVLDQQHRRPTVCARFSHCTSTVWSKCPISANAQALFQKAFKFRLARAGPATFGLRSGS